MGGDSPGSTDPAALADDTARYLELLVEREIFHPLLGRDVPARNLIKQLDYFVAQCAKRSRALPDPEPAFLKAESVLVGLFNEPVFTERLSGDELELGEEIVRRLHAYRASRTRRADLEQLVSSDEVLADDLRDPAFRGEWERMIIDEATMDLQHELALLMDAIRDHGRAVEREISKGAWSRANAALQAALLEVEDPELGWL